MNDNFRETFGKIKALDIEAFKSFISNLQNGYCSKGKHLLRSRSICDSIFFIDSGILREYITTKDKEYNIWFSFEGNIACDMQSMVSNARSDKNFECLTDVKYRSIKRKVIVELASQYHIIETFYRKLLEYSLIKIENRSIRMQTLDAKSRYKYLLEHHPRFISDISLTHLASYLGITKESLSRIRRQK